MFDICHLSASSCCVDLQILTSSSVKEMNPPYFMVSLIELQHCCVTITLNRIGGIPTLIIVKIKFGVRIG